MKLRRGWYFLAVSAPHSTRSPGYTAAARALFRERLDTRRRERLLDLAAELLPQPVRRASRHATAAANVLDAEHDRKILTERFGNVERADAPRLTGQHIASIAAPEGFDDPALAQGDEDLFEVLRIDVLALGQRCQGEAGKLPELLAARRLPRHFDQRAQSVP
jgi:hypothetical protein